MINFLKKIRNAIISFFADIRIYPGGIILFGSSSYKIKGHHMRQILDILQPADVLLRRYDHYLGTYFIPGYFSHAAIYVGENKIIHMLGEGITQEDILTFMRTDDICVLRPKMNENEKNKVISEALMLFNLHVEYDYDFKTEIDKRPKRFYCTEFVNYIFGNPIKKKSNNSIVLPDEFLNCQEFEIIWRKQ